MNATKLLLSVQKLRFQGIYILLNQERMAETTLQAPLSTEKRKEHQSDTKVFTMIMAILPEPTSNKLYGRTSRKMPYSRFQDKEQHVGLKITSTQDGKRSQDDDKRLCLVDDLKKLKITYKSKLKEQAHA
ncbi:hypothetical protein Tco_0805654 [Tanacetum coccineum]